MKIMMRQDIATLNAYEAHVVEGNVRMDANENPFSWPAGMREELLTAKIEFNRYPDGEAKECRKGIAAYNGVRPEEVLVGNGSDELIQLILNTYGGQGRALMIHPPTFSMYQAGAAITATSVIEVPLVEGTKLDVEKMLTICSEDKRQKIIIICNPNNPTGSLFPREDILKIIKGTTDLVVVDEAYFEFSGETLIDAINDCPNLLIMRTFSKAFGMAALRLGYVIGNRELIGHLNKVRQPYNVNAFSQEAGIIALKYVSEYQEQIESINREIQVLYNELKQIPGVTVIPTRANFLLFQHTDAQRWANELVSQGFSTRYFGGLNSLGETIRLSAATPQENKAFIQALTKIVRG